MKEIIEAAYKKDSGETEPSVPENNGSSRKLIAGIIAAVAALFAACAVLIFLLMDKGADTESADTPVTSVSEQTEALTTAETTVTTTTAVTTATAEETTTTTTTETTEPAADSLLVTDYFTLSIPASWEGKYDYDIYPNGDYGIDLNIYHIESHSRGWGGRLFSVRLFENAEDAAMLPAVKYMGELYVHRLGSFYVCATHPTDVQYSTATEDEYMMLYDGVEAVLDTIKPVGENEFYPANGKELPVEENSFEPYTVKVENPYLTIYSGPGYGYSITGSITDMSVYTIVEEDSAHTWGKLKSGLGWINLIDASTSYAGGIDDDGRDPNEIEEVLVGIYCADCQQTFRVSSLDTVCICPRCGRDCTYD